MHTEQRDENCSKRRIAVAYGHGVIFVASGLWPVVHLRSFAAVTGPKPEGWLVKAMGGVLAVIGATMLDAARRRRVDRSVMMLGAGSAAVLAAIDVVYVAKRRISPVYGLDAMLQLGLVGAWALASGRGREGRAVGLRRTSHQVH